MRWTKHKETVISCGEHLHNTENMYIFYYNILINPLKFGTHRLGWYYMEYGSIIIHILQLDFFLGCLVNW